MVQSRHALGLGFLVILVSVYGIHSRALPQGTVTQSGEPSHFQVDDKAAEIEVNANPAGVKVNAKPASLQVVAKPGTPAIPVYHPAIHIAPHYLPPPIIHREPARYFLHRHHCHPCCPPMCFGGSRGWFYSGLRRNGLPKPDNSDIIGKKSSKISRKPERDNLGRELDEDGNAISRKHKSSIPRPEKGHKKKDSNKRQFITGVPQQYMPQGIMSLVAPRYSLANNRAPLSRSLISAYNGGQVLNSPYSASGLNSLYGQPLANSPIRLGTLSNYGQLLSPSVASPKMYSGYGPIQANSQPYTLGPSSNTKTNIINNFLQSELNHELYKSAATPSPFGLDQGYSRSLINTPYNGLTSASGIGGIGSLYGTAPAPPVMGYQGGFLGGYGNYANSPIMQLAQLYAAMQPGLQQTRSTTSLISNPYMAMRSPLISRSNVPGSKKSKSKQRHKRNKSKLRSKRHVLHIKRRSKDGKFRKKRQLLGQDLGDYDFNNMLQDALVNEFKRELILGSQSQQSQLPPITDQQSSLGLPFPGLPPVYDANQQQPPNLMGLSQMAGLDANYVAPLQRMGAGNLANSLARSQALSTVALGRSQVTPDQISLMPSLEQRAPMASRIPVSSSVPFQRQLPQQQGFIQNGANELVGFPMKFREDYRSPIQFEDQRRTHFRRQRHPLFRRRLHPHYYDDEDDYRGSYDDDYHDNREMYHGEHLGRETVSIGGPYSENEFPSNEGETLVDSSNHGFGPITVEAKTAEGVRKSLGEDRRDKIVPLPEDQTSRIRERGMITNLPKEKPLIEDKRGEIATREGGKTLYEAKRGRISILQEDKQPKTYERRGKIYRKSLGEGAKGKIIILQKEQKPLTEERREKITNQKQQDKEKYLEMERRGQIDLPQEEQIQGAKQTILFKSGVL